MKKEVEKMKFCQQCGEALNDNVDFCTKCGQPVRASGTAAQVENDGSTTNVYINQTAAQPLTQLKTDRSLLKFILLSLITFGIYSIVWYSSVSTDINLIASRYDGKKTMHFCLMSFVVAPITFGIGAFVWGHNISARIGNELSRRGIDYSFGASTYWLWNILGLLIVVGPFIYLYKLAKAMNLLCEDFNKVG